MSKQQLWPTIEERNLMSDDLWHGTMSVLRKNGFTSWQQVRESSDEELLAIKNIGKKRLAVLRMWMRQNAPQRERKSVLEVVDTSASDKIAWPPRRTRPWPDVQPEAKAPWWRRWWK